MAKHKTLRERARALRLGPTQIAKALGLSRGHVANVLSGHDTSARVEEYLRQIKKEADR